MVNNRKSQAALEFLMTYGWAILVVLVAIGALAYFGVLSPDAFLPSKCTLPSGIACTDFILDDATTDKITVVLRNGMGFDATSVTVVVSGCTPLSAPATIGNGQQEKYELTCTNALTGGSKFSGQLNVTYTNADTTLVHTIQGSLTGKAQ